MLQLLNAIFRDMPYSTVILNDPKSIKPIKVGKLLLTRTHPTGPAQYYFRDDISGHAVTLPTSNLYYESILVEADNWQLAVTITLKGGTHV